MAGSDRTSYATGFLDLDDEVSVDALPVTGEIPRWLTGSLLRNGPAKFDIGATTVNHWFDGLSMLHRFGFDQGCVSYRNRFLRSQTFCESTERGALSRGGFATDPCRTLFQRIATVFSPHYTDNGNVSIDLFGGVPVALTETTLPVRFDAETLDTLGDHAYDRRVGGQISIAHPHHDAARGCRYSYVVEFGRKCHYRLFSIADADGTETVVAEMDVDCPSYMHSFAMTEHYLVLVEFPLVVDPLRMLPSGQPFIKNYRWQPERGLRVNVFAKDGGRLVQSQTAPEAVFAFHHVNAYEADGDVVIDLVAYPDAQILNELELAPLRAGHPVDAIGCMRRYRLPVAHSGEISVAQITTSMIELPRIDYEACAGRPYRYAWGVGQRTKGNFLDCIVGLDVVSGQALTWWREHCYPGEPVFVPQPGRTGEGQGVLLSVVLDARQDLSFLLVLDALSLEEIARAECPHRIPFGLHGCYLAR
jgi:carotenoid cleavage dioxygenase-like enzyme